MKLLALPFILLIATASPAEAITWKEFWDPLKTENHYHVGGPVHRYRRPGRRRPAMCEHREYREVYDRKGRFVEYYYDTVLEPCWKRSHDHHHH